MTVTRCEDHVGIVQLNRPKVYNALSFDMLDELARALEALDADDSVHVILIHGDDRAFSAGADIKDMADSDAVSWYLNDPLSVWDRIPRIRKPIVAAIAGHALGGGCELAMMCDVIVASKTARFGQPEIKIGIIPGAGGTQRLIRAVGKAVAMDMILSGRVLTADEALAAGLVSRVVEPDRYLEEAMNLAREMATKLSPIALRVAKEAVLKAHDVGLSEGLREERVLFHLLTATEDHTEGMKAFIEKREAHYAGK
ncbi:MAG: enoyl-CoA hydratase/isomerase family protein [Phycisphaerales bacterium]|nr:enoyl-CoA hydratase/isomerase family protein [Phycisphaerales bacterium]